MSSILCGLDIHGWGSVVTEFFPSRDAPIITHWKGHRTCRRCGRKETLWDEDIPTVDDPEVIISDIKRLLRLS